MTPFMVEVQELIDPEPTDGADPVRPAVEASRERPVAEATDQQVILRSLAEQLVAEANAVLRERGPVLDLTDECGPGALAFTLAYRDRSARLETSVSGRSAIARLTRSALVDDHSPCRLAGADDLRALVLDLIAPRSR